MLRALVVSALLLLGLPAAAEPGRAGDILVEDGWARATLGPVRNSAAYMRLVNQGDLPDRLVGVTSPLARSADLHVHLHEDGIVRMRPLQAIEVAPGEATVLQPGGLHVMLVGLEAPLAEGDRLPLTLSFERAGRLELELPVHGLQGGGHAH